MDTWQKERLTAYLMNSTRFLFGLYPGNQKDTYRWLSSEAVKKGWEHEKNFTYNGPYKEVEDDLIKNPGIELLVTDLIIPYIKKTYSEVTLNYLRVMWRKGQRPSDENVRKMPDAQNLSKEAFRSKFLPFFETDIRPVQKPDKTEYVNYVSGWGSFAPIWFSEIEKMPRFADLWEKA